MPAPHNEAERSKSSSPEHRSEPSKKSQLSLSPDKPRSHSVSPGLQHHKPLSATNNVSIKPKLSQNLRRSSANEGSNAEQGTAIAWQPHRRGSSPTEMVKFNPGDKGIMSYIGQEVANVAADANVLDGSAKKLYDGGKIPSRVFKHLQSEFSDNQSNSSSPVVANVPQSNTWADKPRLSPGLLKLLQSDYNKLQNDCSPTDADNSSVVSSSFGEMDEYYRNGIANTATTKETVLKELTSQFDPKLLTRKPKAAPGRVFRYLQQQYDEPEESEVLNVEASEYKGKGSTSPNTSNDVTKRTSPTLEYMNSLNSCNDNAYRDSGLRCINREIYVSQPNETVKNSGDSYENSHSIDEGNAPQTTPYVGKRIPGRTFRMLQENYDTHPSVLQARK